MLARYRDGADLKPESWNLTAPVAGVVLKVAQESETIVQPGAPLLEIGDPRDLEVVVGADKESFPDEFAGLSRQPSPKFRRSAWKNNGSTS